jgi:hypothetical protein
MQILTLVPLEIGDATPLLMIPSAIWLGKALNVFLGSGIILILLRVRAGLTE